VVVTIIVVVVVVATGIAAAGCGAGHLLLTCSTRAAIETLSGIVSTCQSLWHLVLLMMVHVFSLLCSFVPNDPKKQKRFNTIKFKTFDTIGLIYLKSSHSIDIAVYI